MTAIATTASLHWPNRRGRRCDLIGQAVMVVIPLATINDSGSVTRLCRIPNHTRAYRPLASAPGQGGGGVCVVLKGEAAATPGLEPGRAREGSDDGSGPGDNDLGSGDVTYVYVRGLA
jgi:hypothetical protein